MRALGGSDKIIWRCVEVCKGMVCCSRFFMSDMLHPCLLGRERRESATWYIYTLILKVSCEKRELEKDIGMLGRGRLMILY